MWCGGDFGSSEGFKPVMKGPSRTIAPPPSQAYLFDLRRPSLPLASMQGHERAVSYVRFVDGRELVTMAADSTLRLWPVAALGGAGPGPEPPGASLSVPSARVFQGHRNEKHFVGLGVRPDGYILAGSEDNDVLLYHT